ncbi:MAG: rRNA pseudouridine synthase [Candidatus Rokubacteria bacterium]|nr:rRNA pseudouridine synthase [Candidatus Rokubacteria bacterium]
MRLNKILAHAGLASRRHAEALLAGGRVTVNGAVRREPGAQADPARDEIAVDGRPLPRAEALVYLIVHKPRGVLSSRGDPAGRPVIVDLVPAGAGRLFPVGRLDYDAEGLVLLTNDGALAHRLLHPRYEIPRVYAVEVSGLVRPHDLPRWRRGTILHDGPAVPLDVRLARSALRGSRLILTFGEGRNREVKRYCQALGHRVRRLVRIAFGPLRLGTLAPGDSRPLAARELAALGAGVDAGGPGAGRIPLRRPRPRSYNAGSCQ